MVISRLHGKEFKCGRWGRHNQYIFLRNHSIGPRKLFSRCTLRLPENWIFFTGKKKLDPEPMSNYKNSRKIFLHFRFFFLHIAVDFWNCGACKWVIICKKLLLWNKVSKNASLSHTLWVVSSWQVLHSRKLYMKIVSLRRKLISLITTWHKKYLISFFCNNAYGKNAD